MSIKKIEKTITELFKKKKVWYEHDITEEKGNIIAAVYVEWGDWKHDHAYVDYLMRECGFIFIGENVTDEDGSDTYSSIHGYLYKGK